MNNKIVFLNEEIDFNIQKPVKLFVQNYESEQFYFNVFGVIFKKGRHDYHATFRFRFPSGNKTIIKSGIRTKMYSVMVEIEASLQAICEHFRNEKSINLVKQSEFIQDIPKEAQDFEGFMAFLRLSDQFDIIEKDKNEL